MATKTFSARTDERALSYAETLAQTQFGMSFGQYCGSILIDIAKRDAKLPEPHPGMVDSARTKAAATMRAITAGTRNTAIGMLSDEEIKRLIASKYE